MNKQGYIYLLENKIGNEKTYKIGYTKNLDKRLKQLETGNPGEMNIIKNFKTNCGYILEFSIHRFYNKNKIKNEWFNLSEEQVNNFILQCEISENNIEMIKDNYFFKMKYKL